MKEIIYVVNIILAVAIVCFEANSGSDKTIIIAAFAYTSLVVLNVLFGIFSQIEKEKHFHHYYYSALLLVLAIFFFGLLFLLDGSF